jgi:NADPH-dependent 2,4-dienoyl-CoA reductase/sulfur reductase-like enzyme
MRFGLEVAENVRKKVGTDFPVGIRLSGTEYVDNGVMIEDTIAFAKALEGAGINVFHISGGNHHTMHCQVVPSNQPLAFNVWAAEAVKKEVTKPVIASGSITSPELAEGILDEEKADFVGLARPLLADPYFAEKAQEGRAEEIRPCIRCNQGCLQKGIMSGKSLMCSVNVAIGREDRFARLQYDGFDPAPKSKQVFVIGGGPGGLEAARVAALRGQKVRLFEKRDRLGGALIEASVPDFKNDLRPLVDYFSKQLRKLKIDVHLKTEITAQEILKNRPNAVILATGSRPSTPAVRGIEKPHVVNGLDIWKGKEVGKTVLIVGGGMLGSELAQYLGENGKRVILTTRQNRIGYDMEIAHFIVLMQRLTRLGVQIRTQSLLHEVTDDGAIVMDLARLGAKVELKTDHVVIMGGLQPETSLCRELEGSGLSVHAIGDCVQPRGIHEAIYEGHLAARAI